jgi:voltage-gated potassium channel
MRAADRKLVTAVLATAAMVLLIAFAVAEKSYLFIFVILAVVSGSVAFFFTVFPGSRFFSIAFANFLAIYTCIYVAFLEANFSVVTELFFQVAFVLPIFGFICGTWLRRESIREIVVSHRLQEGAKFQRRLPWVLPLVVIGIATFFIPGQALGSQAEGYVLIGAMAVIAVLVFLVSSNISVFLLDTGLVFEALFKKVQRLYIPAFAFFTFYSMNIIVFAAVYRVFDRFSEIPQFTIDGVLRGITFQESLYFSIVTLSTVGYGDIVPASSVLRALSSVQIVLGVLLLLFGFSEIMSYSKEQGSDRRD